MVVLGDRAKGGAGSGTTRQRTEDCTVLLLGSALPHGGRSFLQARCEAAPASSAGTGGVCLSLSTALPHCRRGAPVPCRFSPLGVNKR
jgi:hypothetical protein